MKKHYQQLSDHERFTIELLLNSGKKQADIARLLAKNRSTISREIKRNKTNNNEYLSARAQQMYILRREYPEQEHKFKKLSDEAIAFIVENLNKRSSPKSNLSTAKTRVGVKHK